MKNFDWTQFTQRIVINSSMEKVYSAWTITSQIEAWFLSKARIQSENDVIVVTTNAYKSGDIYSWNWFCYEPSETGKILEANGKDLFQFTFAGDTKVEVKLSMLKDQVVVTLTQSEIPLDDASKQGIRLGCYNGWAFYLVNLKAWLENGVDLRNKDPELAPVVNG